MAHSLLLLCSVLAPELDFAAYDKPRPRFTSGVLEVRTASHQWKFDARYAGSTDSRQVASFVLIGLKAHGWQAREGEDGRTIIDGKGGEPITFVRYTTPGADIPVTIRLVARSVPGGVLRARPPDR